MSDLPLTFTGQPQVDRFRCIVIAQALDLYRKTGMKANRAYTPRAMMTVARELTGLRLKPRDYMSAAIALRSLALNGELPPFDPPYTEQNCPGLGHKAKSE
jgi:hypothetical protein